MTKLHSSQYNSSLVIYDPYSKSSKIIDFPGISHAGNDTYTEYHLNGVDYDNKTGNIFLAASSANSFASIVTEGPGGQIATNYSNANYTGPNHILVFDPRAERLVADVNLASAQMEFYNLTGNLTSGFQDMAEVQPSGDSYAIGTFGNSIVRIPYGSSTAQLWYAPSTYDIRYGFGGVVALGDKLIVSDTISGGLVTFNTESENPQPTYVALQNLTSDYKPPNADGLYSPKRYGGKVILWSDDYNGTSVYGSNDNWNTAHFLGLVENNDPGIIQGAMTSDSFEIGHQVYVVTQIFQYALPLESKKNFLFYDITEEVDAIVENSFVKDSVRSSSSK